MPAVGAQFQASFGALPTAGKVLFLGMIIILLSAGYYLVLHMNITSDIESAKSANVRLQKSLKEARARQEEYLKLRAELADRDPVDRQNMRVLPEAAEIPAFLGDLNRLAELSGLTMVRVQPRPELAQEFFVKIPVALSMYGKYHQLAKFFYNMSRLERAVNLENVKLIKPTVRGEEIVITVDVLATTFRRKALNDKALVGKKKGK
jgi:type IV pilus assembly protein PilO